jgi:hypothetical protein
MENRRQAGPRFWCIAAIALATVLLFVWTSGQIAGLLAHGSWPQVSVLWSVVEPVRVLRGEEPADGIPLALFWLCLVLEAGVAGLLATRLTRRLRTGRRHLWVPPPPEGISKAQPFLASYRQLLREDGRKAAAATASTAGLAASPVPAEHRSLPTPTPALSPVGQQADQPLDVESTARLLAEHFSRDDLHALIGELAERRMGEAHR